MMEKPDEGWGWFFVKLVFSDKTVIALFIFIAGGIFVLQRLYPLNLAQISLTLFASLIALFSYRYSVRSTVRSNVSQVQPVVVDGYKFNPVLNEARWRPLPSIGKQIHNGEPDPECLIHKFGKEMRPKSSIQLLVYDVSGGSEELISAEEAVCERGLPIQDVTEDYDWIIEKNGWEDECEDSEEDIADRGKYLSCYTTNAADARRLAQKTLMGVSENHQ